MATTQSGTSGHTQGTSGTSGRMGMRNHAGVSDDTYDLISVLYHCLQGCQTYQQYADDAQSAGNQELAQFFQDAMQEEQRRAQRGQRLLMQCLQKEQGQGGGQMHSQGSLQGQHMAGSGQGQGQMQGAQSSGSGQMSQGGQSGLSSAQNQSSNESSTRDRSSRDRSTR